MDTYQILTVAAAIGGVLIAAGGLVVSIVSLRRSNTTENQTNRLQKKQEELADLQLQLHRAEIKRGAGQAPAGKQSKAADVRVSLEGSARNPRFVIRNWGYGAANDVDLEVAPLKGNSSPLVQGDADKKLPIPRLAPGSDCSLIAALTFDTGVAFDVSWTWRDEDGTKRSESSRLSL